MAIFNGGSGDDLIVGSNKADRIKGGLGNDTIFGAGGDDELNGNRDNDLIFGGEGEDTIRGNRGNDTLVGDTGNDRMIGGMGDDRLIWNNGDGSDIMKGGRGYDVVEVNGAVDDGDDFELRANGNRAEFERLNLINFTLDVDNVEKFEINGLGGDDTLTVEDLSNTDVQQVHFDGGMGDDLLDASLSNVAIMADGGAGEDLLSGSSVREIADTLNGGEGNDTVIGNLGNDLMIGGEGDDRLIWNNGDGSDIMEGGNGYDVVEVNGAVLDGDDFELRANGDRAEFERLNLINFTLDVDDVEKFEINGLGGDDTLTVEDLSGTDVETVSFDGGAGDDLLDASLSNVAVLANGGDDNDTLISGTANDILIGGNGDNNFTGGEGADIFVVGFDGIDVINDFNRAEGDTLQILASVGTSSLDSLEYDSSSGDLYLNNNQIAVIDVENSDFGLDANIELV